MESVRQSVQRGDQAAKDLLMKENQLTIFEDSKSYASRVHCGNGNADNCPLEFELNNREEFLNPKFVGDFSMDCGNRTEVRSLKEKPYELLHLHSGSLRESVDLLSFNTKAEEAKSFNESECRYSGLPNITDSDSLETETNFYFYTEENLLECELPEMEICCKEINDHSLKEICIDEGTPSQQRVTNASKEDVTLASIDCNLPLQESGTVAFRGSSLYNLAGEDDNIEQLPDQVSSRRTIIENSAASSAESGIKEEIHCNNNKSSHNFTGGISDGIITTKSLSGSIKEMVDANSLDQLHDSTRENSDSPSHYNLQFDSSRNVNSTSSEVQALESHASKPEHRNSEQDSTVSPGNYDVGEPSFLSAGLVAFSGPIPFSGSVSLRSDSSAATSGRSFAFPILQPEWNSSPAKLPKADDGHFRKHKNWRSGLLCCRF